jgi:hypothetical protein
MRSDQVYSVELTPRGWLVAISLWLIVCLLVCLCAAGCRNPFIRPDAPQPAAAPQTPASAPAPKPDKPAAAEQYEIALAALQEAGQAYKGETEAARRQADREAARADRAERQLQGEAGKWFLPLIVAGVLLSVLGVVAAVKVSWGWGIAGTAGGLALAGISAAAWRWFNDLWYLSIPFGLLALAGLGFAGWKAVRTWRDERERLAAAKDKVEEALRRVVAGVEEFARAAPEEAEKALKASLRRYQPIGGTIEQMVKDIRARLRGTAP